MVFHTKRNDKKSKTLGSLDRGVRFQPLPLFRGQPGPIGGTPFAGPRGGFRPLVRLKTKRVWWVAFYSEQLFGT